MVVLCLCTLSKVIASSLSFLFFSKTSVKRDFKLPGDMAAFITEGVIVVENTWLLNQAANVFFRDFLNSKPESQKHLQNHVWNGWLVLKGEIYLWYSLDISANCKMYSPMQKRASVHINNNCFFFVKKAICLPEEPLTFLQIHIVDSQSKSKSYYYYLRLGKCQEISRVFKRYESTGEKLNISPGQQFNIVTWSPHASCHT